jgi:prevent-host-death family protein
MAKQRFSELMAAAEKNGPQVVMRHKDVAAIVLSAADFRRLVRQANANFADLLGHSPWETQDLEPVGMNLGDAG